MMLIYQALHHCCYVQDSFTVESGVLESGCLSGTLDLRSTSSVT